MTTKTPAPDWAIEEACRRLNAFPGGEHSPHTTDCYGACASVTCLADMIAKYEPPPVDTLLEEARRMAGNAAGHPDAFMGGGRDTHEIVQNHYEGLKRGWAMAMEEMGK